jgi:predicted dehydrogenase
VGKVLHVRCVLSAHLADWHPWERYQDFFMASKELGGGALLDESHFIDLMLWFFGMPAELFAKVEHLSSLNIETDDNVDAWLYYSNGMRVFVHLDLYGRPHERSITVTGEEGTLYWSYEHNCLRFSRSAAQEWENSAYSCERNEMFVKAAQEFLEILDTGKIPLCSIEDGYSVLRIIEAMRRSSTTGQVTTVG